MVKYVLSLYIPIADESDFIPITQNVVFEADTTTGRECFTLSITDDEIFEDAELFRVILQPTDDPTINLVTSVLTITIIDDDSKSLVQANPPLFFKTQVLYVPPPPPRCISHICRVCILSGRARAGL